MVATPRGLYVGAAQMAIGASIDENLDRIIEYMRRGAEQGLEVMVFPEAALTGYSPSIGRGRAPEEWSSIREALKTIGQACAELGLWSIVGSEAWNGKGWVNRVYAYSDTGQPVARYDKVHLTRSDVRYYLPGEGATVFDLKGIRVGLQICYDVRFPEGYRELLAKGAQIIVQGFYGSGGNTWKVPVLEAHLRSRAAESGCFVVGCNVAGPLQIVVSQIVDPLGLVLARANQDCEEIIKAELDLKRLGDSEIRQDFLERFR